MASKKCTLVGHTDNDTSYLDCQSSRAHMALPQTSLIVPYCVQVANDSLSLRQPVHNTCLAYLSTTHQHLLAGTQRGDIRRYDTRAARKPVAEWKRIVPAGSNNGIGTIEKGFHE